MVARALLGIGAFFNGFVEGQKDRVERERWQLMNEYYRMIMNRMGWDPTTHSWKTGYGPNGSISPVFGTGTSGYDQRDPVFHGGDNFSKMKENIAQIEGNNYSAVNKSTGALGRYQVMPANLAPWTKEALGHELTKEQFLGDHNAQEQVADYMMKKYYNQTGSLRDVTSMWFTGKPWAQGQHAHADAEGTTPEHYVNTVMRGIEEEQPKTETVKTEGTKPVPTVPTETKPTIEKTTTVPAEAKPRTEEQIESPTKGYIYDPVKKDWVLPAKTSQAEPFKPYQVAGPWEPPPIGAIPKSGGPEGPSAADEAAAATYHPKLTPPEQTWSPEQQGPPQRTGAPPTEGMTPSSVPPPAPSIPIGGGAGNVLEAPTPGVHSGFPEPGKQIDPALYRYPASSTPTGAPDAVGLPPKPGSVKKGEVKKEESKKGEAKKEEPKKDETAKAPTIDSQQRPYAMAAPGQHAVGTAQSPLSYDPYWKPNPPTAMQPPKEQTGIAKTPQAPAPAVISRDQFQSQKGPEYAAAMAGQRTPMDPGIRAQLNKPDQPTTAVGGGGGPQASMGDMQNTLAMMERMMPSSSSNSSSGGFDPRALPDDSGAQTGGPPQPLPMVETGDRMAAQPGGGGSYGLPRQQDVDFSMYSRKGGVVWKAQTGGAAPAGTMTPGLYFPQAPAFSSDMVTALQGQGYTQDQINQLEIQSANNAARNMGDLWQAQVGSFGGPSGRGGYTGQQMQDMSNAAGYYSQIGMYQAPTATPAAATSATPSAPPNTTTQTTAPMPASQNAATDAYLSNINAQNTAAQTKLQTDLQAQQASGTAAANLANTKSTTAQPYTAPTPQVSSFTSQANATNTGVSAGDQAATISPLTKSYAGFDDGGDVGPAALGPPPGLGGGQQQQIPPYYYNPYTYAPSAAPVGKGVSATSVGTVLPSAAVPTYADGGEVDDGGATIDSPQPQQASYDPVIAGDMYSSGMGMPGMMGGMGMGMGYGMGMPSVSSRGTIRLPTMGRSQNQFMGVPGIPDPPEYQEGGAYAKPANAPPAASAVSDHNGNPSPDIIQAIQHGMQSLMGMFGLQSNRGMPDPQQKQNQQAFANTTAGDLGVTPQHVEAAKDTVDPMHHLNDSMRYLAGLGAMYKWYMLHGQEETAGRVAAGMLMYSRDLAAKYGQEALKALNQGDEQLAAEYTAMGYSAVPNGQIYDMRKDHDGNYSVGAFNMNNQKIWETRIAPEMITAAAVGLRDGVGYWRTLQSSASKYLPGEEKSAQKEEQQAQDIRDQQAIEQGAAKLPRSASAPGRMGTGGTGQPFKLPGQGAPQVVPAGATGGFPPAGGIPRFPSVNMPPSVQQVNAGAPRSPSGQGTSQSVTPPPTSDSQLAAGAQPMGAQPKEDLSDFPGAPTMERAQALSTPNMPTPASQPVGDWQATQAAIHDQAMNTMWTPDGKLYSRGQPWDDPGNLQDYLKGVTDTRQRNIITKQWMDYKNEYDKAYGEALNEAKDAENRQIGDLKSQQKGEFDLRHEKWQEDMKTVAAKRESERQQQAATLAHQRDLEKEAINAGKLRSDEETEKLIAGPSGDGNALGNLAKALPNGTFQGTSFTPEMQRGLESIYRSAIRHGNDPEDAANAIMTLAQGQDGSGKEVGTGDTKVYGKRFDIDVPMSDGTTLTIRLPANAAHNLRVINDQFYKAGISKATQEGHDIATRERSQAASADIARRTQQGLQSGIPRTPQGLPPDVRAYPELVPPR